MQRSAAAAQQVPKPIETLALVLAGDPADAITEEANREAGTLIAISTHGRSGLGRWVLGSVTDKVVRMAETPVLIVRAREQASSAPRITRIILPLQRMKEAFEAALQPAVRFPRAWKSASPARSISPMVYGDTFADYVPTMYADLTAEIRHEVTGYLQATANKSLYGHTVASMSVQPMDMRPQRSLTKPAKPEQARGDGYSRAFRRGPLGPRQRN